MIPTGPPPARLVPVTDRPADSLPARVDAVVARTREVLALPALTESMLAPWERRRLNRIRLPARRDDVLAARLLLRHRVARLVGGSPAEMEFRQSCGDCAGTDHGRPYLPDHPELGVSLSHADGLVAAVVGPGPVGVDVEPHSRRPPSPTRFAQRFPDASEGLLKALACDDPPSAVLRLWVVAEARYKAGTGDLCVTAWMDPIRGAVCAVAARTEATVSEWEVTE